MLKLNCDKSVPAHIPSVWIDIIPQLSLVNDIVIDRRATLDNQSENIDSANKKDKICIA